MYGLAFDLMLRSELGDIVSEKAQERGGKDSGTGGVKWCVVVTGNNASSINSNESVFIIFFCILYRIQ